MKQFLIWTFLLYFITSILISQIPVSSQSLKHFGESCDGDCDERVGLSCSPAKTCECMSPNATTYDSHRSICVAKAGYPCRRIGSENLCVPHSSCKGLGSLCECEQEYFQNRNGSCSPTSKYGEFCSSKKPCDKSSGIECIGKNKQFQCQCKYPRDQYYSSEEKKCVSYAGGNCTQSCVKNAICSQEIFELRRGETPTGKSYFYNATVGKKCVCLEGYRMTQNRECLATYQTSCGEDICNSEENLKCFDSICLCHNPLQQVYSEEKQKCLNLVDSRCDSKTSDCVPNAECDQGVCKCKTGFSSNDNRACLKDFGEDCQKNECNLDRALTCQNGTCGCLGELVYNGDDRRCEGVENSPCGNFKFEDGRFSFISVKDNFCSGSNGIKIECGNNFNCQRSNGYYQCK